MFLNSSKTLMNLLTQLDYLGNILLFMVGLSVAWEHNFE